MHLLKLDLCKHALQAWKALQLVGVLGDQCANAYICGTSHMCGVKAG